jgi:hypothetical protein
MMKIQYARFLFLFFFSILWAEETLDERAQRLVAHVQASLAKAEQGISKLDARHFAIEGMTSPCIQRLLNNLCSWEDAVYLEIGVWRGATLISAVYGNTLKEVIAIDNWSEFEGPRAIFFNNIKYYLPGNNIKVIEHDSFSVDKESIFHNPVNIYFYDGNHRTESQKLAFTYYHSVLDDVFVALVDDWEWDDVKAGTFAAWQELGYKELYRRTYPRCRDWHNGFMIAVLQKT